MKRVDLVAPPMAGHLHSVLGIAARLAEEPDLAVRVISTPAAQPEIAASGLTGIALVGDADDVIDQIVNPPYRVGSNPRRLMAQFRATVRLQQLFQDELSSLWSTPRPDLVLSDFTVASAGPAAERLGIPWWTIHPSPCVIDGRSGPPAYAGGWRPGVGVTGRTRDAFGRAWTRGFKRGSHRLYRQQLTALGVPRVYRPDGSEAIYSSDRIFGLTPGEIEFTRDVPEAVRYVGPVLFTPPNDSPAPVFAAGRRPVLVTAGTHLAWYKRELLEQVAAAAARMPEVEFHVTLGGNAADVPRPDGIVVHDRIDYARDVAGFAAVVHHGGAGIMGHTLAAGLPSVVRPVDYDQFDNAARLVAAGVAVRQHHPEGLASRVREVLDRPSYRRAAEAIATRLHQQPAVDVIARDVREHLAR